jgi:DNA polymerase III epsilon subunit-like protein
VESIAVIDFETTGVSPAQARATEIGVAIIEGGQIVARYQSLMNSGTWVPPFIEQLTGISNAMLREAPSHKLGNLNRWAGLPDTGRAHRALADAEMAANLTLHLFDLLRRRHGRHQADHGFLCQLQKLSAAKVRALLAAG